MLFKYGEVSEASYAFSVKQCRHWQSVRLVNLAQSTCLQDIKHWLSLHNWVQVDEEQLSVEEMKERKIMKLLLKVKNGTPPQRKSALRQLTDKARDFGAGPLFNQILPLLMSPTLEDQERHLLVKVWDPPQHANFIRLLPQELHSCKYASGVSF